VTAPVLRTVIVRNSSGVAEERPVIVAQMRLGLIEKQICLTVTRRRGMRFRILLGREALAGDFVVDARQKYLLAQ